MDIACVIPARFNSSRFPGKLLAKANGKTVLQRTVENAKQCKVLSALFVATDDERIADHVHEMGVDVLWTSTKPRDGTERLIEAMSLYDSLKKNKYLVLLQGDHPCTNPKTIEKIVEALAKDPTAVMSTAVASIRNKEDFLSPHVVKCVFDVNGNALYFSRSPIPYGKEDEAFAHIGIYCYRRAFLERLGTIEPTTYQIAEDLEQLKILQMGYRIKVAIIEESSPSVDTPTDLAKLEEYLCRQNTFL